MAIIRPSKGVKPMVEATATLPRMAAAEQPPPR